MAPRLTSFLALAALLRWEFPGSAALRLASPKDESPEGAQRRAQATKEQRARLSRDGLLEKCVRGVTAALYDHLHSELPEGSSQRLAMVAGVCANQDKRSTVGAAVDAHEYRTTRGHGCLPEDEDYSDEDIDLQVEAAKDLVVQSVVESVCGTEPPKTSTAPWPEQCPRELAYFIRSFGKPKYTYEAVCGETTEEHVAMVVEIIGRRSTELPFGHSLPCYEQLSEVLKLEPQPQSAALGTLGRVTIDFVCQRTGPPAANPEAMACTAAPTEAVERCGNEVLEVLGRPSQVKLLRYACGQSEQDLASGVMSGATVLQDGFLHSSRRPRDAADFSKVWRACGESRETMLASVDAAFPCACPRLRKALPPRAADDDHAGGADVRPQATSGEDPGAGRSIATPAADRPKGMHAVMQLAHYPVYDEGPLGHLVWPWNKDERFNLRNAGDDPRSRYRPAYREILKSSRNPEVLRVFRFAYNDRIGNSNVGDLAHVCAWGQCDGSNCEGLLSGYKLYVYTVMTDRTRGVYSRCNRNECEDSSGQFGFGYKFLDSSNGCYDGPVNWYSLPAKADGKSWKLLSLDRVVEWKCVLDSGLYDRGLDSDGVFQELDKMLFSVEGCQMCPDAEAPHDSGHRVCPSS